MKLLKIGRDASCDIVINSPNVSSLHAEIAMMNSGDIILEDKNSRNGTYVMNQRIASGKPVNIRRGDAIKFADVELKWSQIPMPEDNSAYRAVYGIGSNFNNDIQISGNTVSRFHATLKESKDGKIFIIDHSKNGTTVDGMKIPSNTPVRIKRKSAVVCGGVPVNLSRYFKSNPLTPILVIAASILLVVGIGFGIWKIIPSGPKTYTDGELYNRFNRSVVMLAGVFHYDISAGDLDFDKLNIISAQLGLLDKGFVFHTKVILTRDQRTGSLRTINASGASTKEIVEAFNSNGNIGFYSATGFFVSNDGKIVTNLHVVKPWLFDDEAKLLEEYKSVLYSKLSRFSEILISNNIPLGLSAYLPQLKIEGSIDYIALIPQGDIFDLDNAVKCRVLSAGNEKEKDVALIQTISKRLPFSDCTYINVQDSIDTSDEALSVGEHVYTIGFPAGMRLQSGNTNEGIQVYAQGGDITRQNSEFDFSYNAATTGGASGSPVFNKYGMLIGVHHAGASRTLTQGYNSGIKAKYIKELVDSPYKK